MTANAAGGIVSHRYRNLWIIRWCIRHHISINGFVCLSTVNSCTSLCTDGHTGPTTNGFLSSTTRTIVLGKTLLDQSHVLR